MSHRIEVKQVLGAKHWFYVAICCECKWARSSYHYGQVERLALEHGEVK